MPLKKNIPLCAAILAIATATAFPNSALAGHKKHGKFKHGKSECREVVQVVKVAKFFSLKKYATACSTYNGGWKLTSIHKHPKRYGNSLYMWDHGRLVDFVDDKSSYYKNRYSHRYEPTHEQCNDPRHHH